MQEQNNTGTKIIGGLVAVVAIWGLWKVLQLADGPKKLDGFNDDLYRYNELTNNNDHTGAALFLAKKYGSKSDVETIKEIQEKQDKRGRITEKEQAERDMISNRLYKRLRK